MGSINRVTLVVSHRLRKACTGEELQEIENWVKRYQAVDELKLKHAALTLPEQLAAATQWLERASAEEAGAIADDLISNTAALRRVLNRRGLL